MKLFLSSLFYLTSIFFIHPLCAQDIFSDLKKEEYDPSTQAIKKRSVEQVIIKSRNRRILIVTNDNKTVQQGDFVTVFSGEQKIAKALVAKVTGRKLALKIISTFSNKFDSLSERSKEIALVRGDAQSNAGFSKKEEDFFTSIDGLDLKQEKAKMSERSIVSLNVGILRAIDSLETNTNYVHYLIAYAYNVANNFWFEANYGYTVLNQFPVTETLTNLHTLNAKLKYNFQLPSYTYFMPYLGLQFNNSQLGEDITLTQAQTNLVQDLNTVKLVGGATIYKRLVPGWMININIGVDNLSGGVSIAF